jgi:hypothetical protein
MFKRQPKKQRSNQGAPFYPGYANIAAATATQVFLGRYRFYFRDVINAAFCI